MARKLKMDFTDVESYIKCAEGEHIAILKEVEEKVSQNGSDMLSCKFEVTRGSSTGAIVFDNFVLGEKSLWKLKSYLEVVGLKADGKVMLDLDKLTGKTCIIQVKYEEYNGSNRAKIDGYKKLEASTEEDDEDYEEEEEEPTPPKKKPASKPAPVPAKKKKPAPVEEEDEDEDFEEEEEETPPPKKKPAKKPAPAKKKPAPPQDEDEDEDEEWEEE